MIGKKRRDSATFKLLCKEGNEETESTQNKEKKVTGSSAKANQLEMMRELCCCSRRY